ATYCVQIHEIASTKSAPVAIVRISNVAGPRCVLGAEKKGLLSDARSLIASRLGEVCSNPSRPNGVSHPERASDSAAERGCERCPRRSNSPAGNCGAEVRRRSMTATCLRVGEWLLV